MMTDVKKTEQRIHVVTGAILAAFVVIGIVWCAWIVLISITGSAKIACIVIGCTVVFLALVATWVATSCAEDWD